MYLCLATRTSALCGKASRRQCAVVTKLSKCVTRDLARIMFDGNFQQLERQMWWDTTLDMRYWGKKQTVKGVIPSKLRETGCSAPISLWQGDGQRRRVTCEWVHRRNVSVLLPKSAPVLWRRCAAPTPSIKKTFILTMRQRRESRQRAMERHCYLKATEPRFSCQE